MNQLSMSLRVNLQIQVPSMRLNMSHPLPLHLQIILLVVLVTVVSSRSLTMRTSKKQGTISLHPSQPRVNPLFMIKFGSSGLVCPSAMLICQRGNATQEDSTWCWKTLKANHAQDPVRHPWMNLDCLICTNVGHSISEINCSFLQKCSTGKKNQNNKKLWIVVCSGTIPLQD